MDLAALADRWRRCFPAPLAGKADEAFAEIARRYGEPGRYYHTLAHVACVLDSVALLEPAAPRALEMAAWLHDVIYDSRASDNEERSAELARDILAQLGAPEEERAETSRLILLTKSHITESNDRIGAVLLDADLAILGAAPADYDDYAAAIRREYAWVAEADYRAGRRRVLERFLARARIYVTATMAAQAEGSARANLVREIAGVS
jgi:predicted metal-dependent HD superfamily phosphohydrolase